MKKPYFLYIIDSSGVCLFSYNFKKDIEMFQNELFSGFITAITLFSSELNSKLGYTEKHGRLPAIPLSLIFEIMISYMNPLVGVLVVEKKDIDQDMKDFLNAFLNSFIKKYEDKLKRWDGELTVFGSFKDDVEKIFKKMELFSFQIPKMKEISLNKSVLNENYVALIKEIDGKKSIKELSEKMGKTIDETKTMISNILWSEFITLSEKIYEDDVFEPKRDLFYLIRTKELDPEEKSSNLSEQVILEQELLKTIDGFKTVFNISRKFPNLTLYETKRIFSYYFSKGSYFEKVDLYPQIIKISEDFFEKMTTEDLALSYSLENMCDGESSLADLSKKTGFPLKDIKRILDFLGTQVFYKKKYVK
ncbi:hypothetical protein LCGC14_0981920 [marine sediment metagenome]|uniref:UCP01524 winged helix-turn-helix domain-containing protein n=1 Tax=marine sediment metagenome TaxID=412755 RepID=A0A0F9NUV0_9ZZZZ